MTALEQLFPLRIFPPGLDHSILIPVWVGALLLFVATERFGWGFVGLVVPGYLTSVLISRPVSAAALILEILLTLACIKAHMDWLPRRGWIYTPFGRERFFLVVVWGSAVRIVTETWGVPFLFGSLPPTWIERLGLDTWQPDFYGIGLVLVPLTANMLWRNHLSTGGIQLLLATGATYALTRWVLLPYTNLSFSEFQLVFEDAAVQLESQPKAYVILLVGAMLAARANQLYGWDFNGILVPSLLGIAWLWPVKVASTLVEVLCVVLLARALIRLPGVRSWNVEGPRRITLILTLDLLYKSTLVQAVPLLRDSIRAADLFGFGYLLPALLATKVWVRKDIPGILIPTFLVSVQSFVGGSAAAFLLGLIPLPQVMPERPAPVTPLELEPAPHLRLADAVARAARASATENPDPAPEPDGLALLSELAEPLLQRSGALPEQVEPLAQALGLTPLEGALESSFPEALEPDASAAVSLPRLWRGYVEAPETFSALRGTGGFFRRVRGANVGSAVSGTAWPSLLVLPLDPEADGARAAVAADLFERSDAPVLAVPGGQVSLEGILSPSLWPLPEVLQRLPRWLVVAEASAGQAEGLYLPEGLPPDFPLESLTSRTGPLRLIWAPLPDTLQPWVDGLVGFHVGLVLAPTRWTRLAGALERPGDVKAEGTAPSLPAERSRWPAENTPRAWLEHWTGRAAVSSPLPSRAQSELRMLRWHTEVVRPLLDAVAHPALRAVTGVVSASDVPLELPTQTAVEDVTARPWREEVASLSPLVLTLPARGQVGVPREVLLPLRRVALVALSFGYRLHVAFPEGSSPLVALLPIAPEEQRTAALILRPGGARSTALFLSDPQEAGMLPLSWQWLESLDAQALIVDGAPSDLAERAAKAGVEPPLLASHASVFFEALLAEPLQRGQKPRTVMRLEALAAGRYQPAEVALAGPALLSDAAPQGSSAGSSEEPPVLEVASALQTLGLRVALHEGQAWGASLRLPSSRTTGFGLALGQDRLVVARASRSLRQSALGEAAHTLLEAAAYLGLTVSEQPLEPLLRTHAPEGGEGGMRPEVLQARLKQVLVDWKDWVDQGGSSRLIRLIEGARLPGRRLTLIRDRVTGRLFLLSRGASGSVWCLSVSAFAAAGTLDAVLESAQRPVAKAGEAAEDARIQTFLQGYTPLFWLEPTRRTPP